MGKLSRYRKLLSFALGLSILIPISIFIWKTDFTIVKKEITSIGMQYIIILITTFVGYILGTLSWQVCLGKYKNNISIFRLFGIRQVGETIGLYNPTSIIAGDFIKAEFLKPYNIPADIALESVVSSRTTAILSQILLFIIGIIWLLLSPLKEFVISHIGFLLHFLIALLIFIKIVLFIWLNNNKPYNILNKANKKGFFYLAKIKVLHILNRLRIFYQQDKSMFWCSYFLAALHWIIGSMELYWILHFLGYKTQIMEGLVLDMSIILIKSTAAFIPGQLGIEEIANKITLTMIGITGSTIWITVSILRRTRQLFWIIIGFILYTFLKKEIKHVTA